MRIVRLADLPAVMYIRRHDDILVAVPDRLPRNDVLAMASLVLSGDEFAELAGSAELTGSVTERWGDQPGPPGA